MVDQNDNMDDDLGSFEEAEYLTADRDGATPPKQNFKEIWEKNPSLKIFAGIAGVALILITFMVFGAGDEPTDEEVSAVKRSADVTQVPGTEELPPAYEEAVRQSNKETADIAAESGGSALPTPIARPSERIEAPIQVEETDPLSEWRKEAETRRIERQKREEAETLSLNAPPALPVDNLNGMSNGVGGAGSDPQNQNPPLPLTPSADQITQMAQQLTQQMTSVLESQIPKESAVVSMNIQPQYDIKKYFPPAPVEANARNNGGQNNSGNNGMQQVALKPIISAGTIAYAQILTEANSDVPGPVLAEVASGPLLGGRAIGTFTVAEDHMVLQFTRIVKDGVEYQVQAFALDPATTLPGMASDVNKHYFTRIMIPAAASFISGFAEAATKTDSTTVVVDSTVVTDEEDLDTREELLKGVNEAAQKASEVIDEDSDREPTIRVFAGTRIGLLFVNSVMDPNAQPGNSGGYGSNTMAGGGNNPYGQMGQAVFQATPYGQAYSAYQNYTNTQQQQRQAAIASITPKPSDTPPKPIK